MTSETTSVDCETGTANIELTSVVERSCFSSTSTEHNVASVSSISTRTTVPAEPPRYTLRFRALKLYEKIQNKSWLLGKLLLVVSFVVTAVALWPSFSGAADSKRANLLAEWTARKDYFEFCESHNWEIDGCQAQKGKPLGPPPVLDPRANGEVHTTIPDPERMGTMLYLQNLIVVVLLMITVASLRPFRRWALLLWRKATLWGDNRRSQRTRQLHTHSARVSRRHEVNSYERETTRSDRLNQTVPVSFGSTTSTSFEFTFSIDGVTETIHNDKFSGDPVTGFDTNSGLRQRNSQLQGNLSRRPRRHPNKKSAAPSLRAKSGLRRDDRTTEERLNSSPSVQREIMLATLPDTQPSLQTKGCRDWLNFYMTRRRQDLEYLAEEEESGVSFSRDSDGRMHSSTKPAIKIWAMSCRYIRWIFRVIMSRLETEICPFCHKAFDPRTPQGDLTVVGTESFNSEVRVQHLLGEHNFRRCLGKWPRRDLCALHLENFHYLKPWVLIDEVLDLSYKMGPSEGGSLGMDSMEDGLSSLMSLLTSLLRKTQIHLGKGKKEDSNADTKAKMD